MRRKSEGPVIALVCTVCRCPVGTTGRCLCDSVAENRGRTRPAAEQAADRVPDRGQYRYRGPLFRAVVATLVLGAAAGCKTLDTQSATLSFSMTFGGPAGAKVTAPRGER